VADGTAASDAATVGQISDLEYLATNSTNTAVSAVGDDALALGGAAVATGDNSLALGRGSRANERAAVALGVDTRAGTSATAVGGLAAASGERSTAVGREALASGSLATSVGGRAEASGSLSTAIGFAAAADGVSSVAIGQSASATRDEALALGFEAQATGRASVAFGSQAVSAFDNSLAFGFQAAASRANQFVFGTTNYSYTMPGLPTLNSNSLQSGDLFYVTVDASGNLGYQTTPIGGGTITTSSSNAPAMTLAAPDAPTPSSTPTPTPTTAQSGYSATSVDGGPASVAPSGQAIADGSGSASGTQTLAQAGGSTERAPVEAVMLDADQSVAEPPAQMAADAGTRSVITPASSRTLSVQPSVTPAVSMVSQAQFNGLQDRVSGLETRVSAIEFSLDDVNQRASGGIAAAMAMGGAPIVPGKNLSMTVAAANFRGEQALAGSITGRLTENVYISASLSTNTADDDVGGRVAATFGF
ncbi:MAG: YadA-like family protein, partial [Pseudomonadota bacterium]